MSQAELARCIDRTPAFVSQLEQGRTKQPTYADVVAIAKALDWDPSDLSFGPPRKRRMAKRLEQDPRRAEAGR